MPRAFSFFCSLVLACVPASASEWIVDAAGGGHFTDLPPAITAARAGDVLVVRAGHYSGFTLDEGLSIVGSGSSTVVNGSVIIRNTARMATTQLRAFVIQTAGFPMAPLVRVENCVGLVAFEDLAIDSALAAIDVTNSEVLIRRCVVHSLVQAALQATSATVVAYGSEFETLQVVPSGTSLPAMLVYGSRITLAGGRVQGGAGAPGSYDPFSGQCVFCGSGGPGIMGHESRIFEFGTNVIRGGAPGECIDASGTLVACGIAGPKIAGNAQLVTFPRGLPQLTITGPLRVGANRTIASTPGLAPVLVFVSSGVASPLIVLESSWGPLALDLASAFAIGATSGPSNGLTVSLPTIPQLAGVLLTVQGLDGIGPYLSEPIVQRVTM